MGGFEEAQREAGEIAKSSAREADAIPEDPPESSPSHPREGGQEEEGLGGGLNSMRTWMQRRGVGCRRGHGARLLRWRKTQTLTPKPKTLNPKL